MHNKLEKMWKEWVVVDFKYEQDIFPEEQCETLKSATCLQGRLWIRNSRARERSKPTCPLVLVV